MPYTMNATEWGKYRNPMRHNYSYTPSTMASLSTISKKYTRLILGTKWHKPVKNSKPTKLHYGGSMWSIPFGQRSLGRSSIYLTRKRLLSTKPVIVQCSMSCRVPLVSFYKFIATWSKFKKVILRLTMSYSEPVRVSRWRVKWRLSQEISYFGEVTSFPRQFMTLSLSSFCDISSFFTDIGYIIV